MKKGCLDTKVVWRIPWNAVASCASYFPLLFLSLTLGILLNPHSSPPSHFRNVCQHRMLISCLECWGLQGKLQVMSTITARHWNPSDHIWFWQGSFVAAFASSNLGDVSPNTKGPFCVNTGESCDNPQSTCPVGGVSMSYLIYINFWQGANSGWSSKYRATSGGPLCIRRT